MTHRSPLHPYHPSTGPSAWGGPRAAFRHSPVHIPVRFESRIEGCRCGAPPRNLGLGDPGLVEGRQSQLPRRPLQELARIAAPPSRAGQPQSGRCGDRACIVVDDHRRFEILDGRLGTQALADTGPPGRVIEALGILARVEEIHAAAGPAVLGQQIVFPDQALDAPVERCGRLECGRGRFARLAPRAARNERLRLSPWFSLLGLPFWTQE